MTKSRESGENEITIEAKGEAARSGRHICEVLEELLRKANRTRDRARIKKVERAQKYEGCRNIQKRRGRK
jgi:hypothetical protein